MENIVDLNHGVKMIVKDPKEHQQSHWMHGGFYESHGGGLLSYLFTNKVRYKNKKVLDIGASIGNHSIYFVKALGCTVTAIEPAKDSYAHLIENIALNDLKINTHNVALGEEVGMCSMENVSKTKYNAGMYQVREGNQVPLTMLDKILVSNKFDWIKIDVEHYNRQLLNGGEKFFKNQNRGCEVFIECEDDTILLVTKRIMQKYGYNFDPRVKVNHTPTYRWIKK